MKLSMSKTEVVILDVETTGLSCVSGDRIIEIAGMKIKDGQIIGQFHSLIQPKRSIPSQATAVNHITDEMVADAPLHTDVLPRFVDFIGAAAVAGHNVKFDLGFIAYELSLMGRRIPDSTPAIDTLKMARDLLPYLSNHKLGYLARSLGVMVEETHRALADVELTVKVFWRLMSMAQEQGLDGPEIFLTQFGVEKPTFKMAGAEQSSLF